MPRKLTVAGRLCVVAVAAAVVSLIVSVGFPSTSKERVVPKFVADRTSTTHPSKTIKTDATCADWAAWIPSRSEPAVVMQVPTYSGQPFTAVMRVAGRPWLGAELS